MSDALIQTATAADVERCLAVLALAFGSDPPCRWAWPDPQQYLEAFPRFARAFGGSAIAHGTANYYAGFSGVALWLPPGVAPDEASLVRCGVCCRGTAGLAVGEGNGAGLEGDEAASGDGSVRCASAFGSS